MFDFSSFSLQDNLTIVLKLCLAIVAGGAIGLNRQLERKPAGLRTHMLVSLGAAIFVLIPLHAATIANNPDLLSRGLQGSLQGVATGVGFLGAGEIFHQHFDDRSKDKISGLTSAAAIWISSALGVAVGFGMYFLALAGTIVALVVLKLVKKFEPNNK
jgi:putative Mg2+ transporter-C (MgtC) family protein